MPIEFEWDAHKAKTNLGKHRRRPAKNEQAMKKVENDQMRQEYDFSSGIRGKYLPRLAKGANVVVLDRDMAKVFPSSKAVNDALRVLAEAGRRHGKAKGSTRGV